MRLGLLPVSDQAKEIYLKGRSHEIGVELQMIRIRGFSVVM